MKLTLALSQIKGKTATLQYRIQAACTLDLKKERMENVLVYLSTIHVFYSYVLFIPSDLERHYAVW